MRDWLARVFTCPSAVLMADSCAAGSLIQYLKSQGCVVIHKCTTIRHAKVRLVPSALTCWGLTFVLQSAVKSGADCLSIDGFECTPSSIIRLS